MKLEWFREHKRCLVCGEDDYTVYYHWPANYYPHEKFETCSWDGRQSIELTVVKCNQCGLVYTNPSFKEENLDLVYPEDIIDPKAALRPASLRKNKWSEIIREAEKYLQLEAVVCDIGARYGEFVKLMLEKGYRTFGIELNAASVKIAREHDLPVFEGRIEDIEKVLKELKYERVNAFVMDDVLEHLTNPLQNLKALSAFQDEGDFLFLRQMDHNSLGRKLFRKNWYYYQPAAHMGYFDEKTLGLMLSKAGYEVVGVRKHSLPNHLIYFIRHFITRAMDYTGLGKGLNKLTGEKTFKSAMQIYNGKINYNSIRWHLEDMFLVIAQKK